jgi:hypothetical protein
MPAPKSTKHKHRSGERLQGYTHLPAGKRAEQRKNLRDNTRYDRKVAKLTQPRPNGFGN